VVIHSRLRMSFDPAKTTMTRMLVDPTGGMISTRFVSGLMNLLNECSGSVKQRMEIATLIFTTAVKLISIYEHYGRYCEIEDRLLAVARASPFNFSDTTPKHTALSQDLFIEFDGFLVQVKSILDHCVNVLNFGFNIPFSALTTFGDKGSKIIKQLENNVAAYLRGPANVLIKLIRDNKPWLEVAIEVRDRMNHFKSGGVDLQKFTVYTYTEGNETKAWTPRLHKDQSFRELMKILYPHVFEFCEFFMGFAMLPRIDMVGIQCRKSADPRAIRWKTYPIDIELMRRCEEDFIVLK
jgi:hypothetical protein